MVSKPIVIRFLGGATVEQGGKPLAGRASHRHSIAALALLVSAPGRTISRDKLVAYLWPEGDPASVRHRLNVLVYDLRRAFGSEVITTVNGDLHLDPASLDVDLLRFREALQGGEIPAALACYGGAFLDGFHLPDSVEFDQWVTAERARLTRALERALQAAASQAAAGGDFRLAADYRARLSGLDPLASGPVLEYMNALVAAGDPGSALRAADRHARLLERELGTRPAPPIEELSARLRREGAIPPGTSPIPDRPVPAAHPPDPQPPAPSRKRLQALIASGGVVVLAFIALRLGGLIGSPEPELPGSAQNRVVVLPFAVRADDRLAYLGEGIVDLLTATLDGAGSLRTADPHAVLSYLRRHPSDPADPAAGMKLAARFGAGHFVLGSIVESGGRISMRATLYGAGGRIEAQGGAEGEEDHELFTLVDSLTRQLLAQRYDATRERLSRLAVMTSSSLPAVKAYLVGESRHRIGDNEGAVEAFRTAVREDTTFALAWYRLAVAAEWVRRPHEAAEAVERAVRHAGRLPERDRLLLLGWRGYARGEADRAEAVYQRVVDEYPDELEAWLQLGEIRFHYAPTRGTTIEASRAAFERVLALEPDHEAARVHLARVAALRGDHGALAGYAAGLVRPDPATPLAREMRALLAFATGDRAAIRQLEEELRDADSFTVLGILLSQFYVLNIEGVAWCGTLLAAPERPREVQTGGHLILALVELAQGRRAAAHSRLARVEALDSLRGSELRALMATMPFLADQPADLETLHAVLSTRAGQSTPVAESFFLPDDERLRPYLGPYLLGLVAAHRGNPAEASRMAARLESMAPPPGDSSLPGDLARGVRGEVARRSNRPVEALAEFRQIRERPGYQLVLPSPFDPRVRERFLRARLLEDAGRDEEARAVFASIGSRSLYDLPFLAPAQLRLAMLAQKRGDEAAARYHYQRFASLWREADATLVPEETAAASLAALARAR